MWSRKRFQRRSDLICFSIAPELAIQKRKSVINDVIEAISRFNIKNFSVKDIMGMPPIMRYEFLEKYKREAELAAQRNPMGQLE